MTPPRTITAELPPPRPPAPAHLWGRWTTLGGHARAGCWGTAVRPSRAGSPTCGPHRGGGALGPDAWAGGPPGGEGHVAIEVSPRPLGSAPLPWRPQEPASTPQGVPTPPTHQPRLRLAVPSQPEPCWFWDQTHCDNESPTQTAHAPRPEHVCKRKPADGNHHADQPPCHQRHGAGD